MQRSLRVSIATLAVFVSFCAASFASPPPYSPPAKRDYAPSLQSVGGGASDFHILRIEQPRSIPAGSSVGVISYGSPTLSLFVESDFMSKGFSVRQMDIYSLMTQREKALTDPADDIAFLSNIVQNLGSGDKEGSVSLDKLLPSDKIDLENQLAEHYLTLYGNLRKLVSLLNVDYIVVVGPVFKELSYALRIYDAGRADLVYSCMFAGDPKQWRQMVGAPQKNPLSSSYDFKPGSEPTAYWEMVFSKFAVDRMKIGAAESVGKSK